MPENAGLRYGTRLPIGVSLSPFLVLQWLNPVFPNNSLAWR